MSNIPPSNYTQFPNYIIDEWMAQLTHAEFKIISLIIRYTLGYHRRIAQISNRHFEEKCKIHKKWIQESINKFEQLGWIKVVRGDHITPNTYEILLKSDDSKKDGVGDSLAQGGRLSSPGVGDSLAHNKERETKKGNNKQPSADVAVFSCLKESWISKKFACEIMAMGIEESFIAQKVAITKKKATKNLPGFLRTAIAEDYQASKTSEEIFEENKSFARKIYESITKRPAQGSFLILNKCVEFSWVSSCDTLGYGEKDFENRLKAYMDKWGYA